MVDLTKSFTVDKNGLSLDDDTYIFTTTVDLALTGFAAPIGSTAINPSNGNHYLKFGSGNTDWELFATESDLTSYLPLAGGTLTGNLQLNNHFGIGGTNPWSLVKLTGNLASGGSVTYAHGIIENFTIQSDVTQYCYANYFIPSTQATSFTLSNLYGYITDFSTLGAGSAVTNYQGFTAASGMTNCGGSVKGFVGNINAGNNNWNCYMPGTAPNYFNALTTFNNSIKITTGAGAGKVLTSDASGNASWQTQAGSDGWTYIKLASDFVTSSTTYSDITSLSFSEVAGNEYLVEAKLLYNTANTNCGAGITTTFPSGLHSNKIELPLSPITINRYRYTTSGTSCLGLSCTADTFIIEIDTVCLPTSSGTYSIQARSEVSGTNVTILAGSYLRYRTI